MYGGFGGGIPSDYGWGPWAGKMGPKGGAGPYGKGGGAPPLSKPPQPEVPKPAKGDMPPIVWISVPSESSMLVQQGYPSDVPAVEFWKEYSIFSESHYILSEFFDNGFEENVEFNHDANGDTFPEVHAAWKAAGQEENLPTIATCPSLGKWAVGFGGQKNALRAAKLALAVAIATDNPPKLGTVVHNYPAFRQLLESAGMVEQA